MTLPGAFEDDEVVRPALPLLLFPIAGLWAGLYGAERCVWAQAGLLPIFAMILGLAVAAAVCFVLGGRRRELRRIVCSTLLSCLAGLVLGSLFWAHAQISADTITKTISLDADRRFGFRVLEDPKQGAISKTSLAWIDLGEAGNATVRILWGENQEAFGMGISFTATTSFKPLNVQQEFLFQNGVIGSVTVHSVEVGTIPSGLLDGIYAFREHNLEVLSRQGGEGAALLKGVLLGETSELDASDAGRDYKATGLSHLVAVSGGHLVVIAGLLSLLLKRLRLRRSVEIAVISLFLIAFVFLTGLQPSAIRATVMTFIAGVGPLLGRRSHIPSALSVAAIGMLAFYPPTAFSIGFWLSVFAVFGLAVFFPLIARYLHCLIPRRMRETKAGEVIAAGLADPLAMTMTAQATTVPITASVFSTLSTVSPLANLLVTPLVTVLVAGGVVTLCVRSLLGPFGDILVTALCLIAELSVSIAGFCASLPYACLPMALDLAPSIAVMVLLAALLYRFWPQPTKRRIATISTVFGLFVAVTVVVALLPVRAQLVMLDVGQGDALLVRDGSGTVLIDTGKSDTMLLEGLARQNVHALDAVIITHPDEDHCGALGALVGGVPVSRIYFAEGLQAAEGGVDVFSMARRLTGTDPQSLVCGDTIKLGNHLSLTVLWPEEPIAEGGNDESICLELDYDHEADGIADIRALLTGDLEKEELGLLLARMEDTSFDILKVGHHGSRNALSPSLAERLQPDIALIGVGENNYYGHPTSDTLEALDEVGARTLRTDKHGNIALYFDKLGVELRCDTISDV